MQKLNCYNILIAGVFAACLSGLVMAADTPSVTAQDQTNDVMAAGRQAVQNKNWTQAIASFKKAVAENPKNADAYNLLGYSHRAQGKFDDAFTAYDKALAIEPKHKGALEYSGLGYLKTNQKVKAEAQLAKLKAICATCEETSSLTKALADYKPGIVSSTY